jgi:1-deoxy-D-xylulose-5-phosphate reductoisomerase
MPRSISILGSTGSVGRSTLAVVDAFPDSLRVVGLAAGGNIELLVEQIERYRPSLVSVRDEGDVARLRARVTDVEIVHGTAGASAVASMAGADAVIAAIVGAAGIPPVYAALCAGKRVGIANKEVLVAAGDVMTRAAREHGGEILPVDSEHNAVHQAIRCGSHQEIQRIILTASGGPFLKRDLSTFDDISIEAALAHPTWRMGNKISIDSATMMNKGLELIEAHLLFGLPADQVEIVVHPQSVIHSMVAYRDGSVLAQLGTPDMRVPITHALGWPARIDGPAARLDFTNLSALTFERPDSGRFPSLRLAREALVTGGFAPIVMNAANEAAVSAFLARRIGFLDIARVVEGVMIGWEQPSMPVQSLQEVHATDLEARRRAEKACQSRRLSN